MTRTRIVRTAIAVGVVAALSTTLAACSSGGSDGKTTISFLTGSDTTNAATGKALIAAFEKENPNITVKLDGQAGGTAADNAVKTKLSTGSMDEVFFYNSGSLFQALNPDTNLVDLSGESWVKSLTSDFKGTVSTSKGTYGAPLGTSLGGGVMYNKDVYKKLGLSVPKDWSEFISNSKKIKAAGITAVEATYGDTWTSQMPILSDFANIVAQDPNWAENYTANKAKYSDQPAFASWEHLANIKKEGLLNEDFASATNAAGLKAVADGTAGQYPMLSSLVSTIAQNTPDAVDKVGFFAMPADDAANTQLTVWQPSALYIPKSATGAKLDAAKKFVAFANSEKGCEIQNKDMTPSGPYVTSACTLPSNVPALLNDLTTYFKDKKTASALEFVSPVKGPNLENIAIQVGSGTLSAKDGASQYDQDVKKQAQQLGLKGW